MLIAAFLSSVGQLFWKLGFSDMYFMVLGFICYGGGAILMIKSYSLEKLSIAYPIMSTSYIFALVFGYFILNENITWTEVFAVFLIFVGVVLTSYDQ